MIFAKLQTQFRRSEIPWSDYPRPQFKRESYLCLNGEWEFGEHKDKLNRKITVPFPPESELSGIGEKVKKRVYYRKTFTFPEGFIKKHTFLHFTAIDQSALIFFNGVLVDYHVGGLPFAVKVTPKAGENTLYVIIKDSNDIRVPYGKQRKKRGGMWYTPYSGICGSVWCESLPDGYISTLRVTPTLSSVTVEAVGGGMKTIRVDACGEIIEREFETVVTLDIPNPINWTPENPHLYNFTVTSGEDKVESYFALRTLTIGQYDGVPRLLLNGKPRFFNGLLDQGYFPDGICLPPSSEGYEYDIKTAKSLGFNMLRKHIKVEPPEFYYLCDKLGMMVWQDAVNNGKYSFIRDTALPTFWVRKLPEIFYMRSQTTKRNFICGLIREIDCLYNSPCIVGWTIFNEGWGQFQSKKMYEITKNLDSTRFVDTTSGWFDHNESDVKSVHMYFRPVPLSFVGEKRPYFLSEFGGFSCKIKGHMFNALRAFGYKNFSTGEELEKALVKLYRDEVVPAFRNGLSGAVYTQLTDVEDEVNGFLTYDRKVLKVHPDAFKEVFELLKDPVEPEENNT